MLFVRTAFLRDIKWKLQSLVVSIDLLKFIASPVTEHGKGSNILSKATHTTSNSIQLLKKTMGGIH